MRVEKTDAVFDRIAEINKICFTGVELPPLPTLRYDFDRGEIFAQWGSTNSIVGYALVGDRSLQSYHALQPYLWSLAVIPGYRYTGNASRILEEIFLHYKDKANVIDLTVNVNNPAQKLYFDKGFRAVRVLPRYYGELSGIRMRRPL